MNTNTQYAHLGYTLENNKYKRKHTNGVEETVVEENKGMFTALYEYLYNGRYYYVFSSAFICLRALAKQGDIRYVPSLVAHAHRQ